MPPTSRRRGIFPDCRPGFRATGPRGLRAGAAPALHNRQCPAEATGLDCDVRYTSAASIVIVALSSLEIGQPLFAVSTALSNAARSAFGIFTFVSR